MEYVWYGYWITGVLSVFKQRWCKSKQLKCGVTNFLQNNLNWIEYRFLDFTPFNVSLNEFFFSIIWSFLMLSLWDFSSFLVIYIGHRVQKECHICPILRVDGTKKIWSAFVKGPKIAKILYHNYLHIHDGMRFMCRSRNFCQGGQFQRNLSFFKVPEGVQHFPGGGGGGSTAAPPPPPPPLDPHLRLSRAEEEMCSCMLG